MSTDVRSGLIGEGLGYFLQHLKVQLQKARPRHKGNRARSGTSVRGPSCLWGTEETLQQPGASLDGEPLPYIKHVDQTLDFL